MIFRRKYLIRTTRNHTGKACNTWNEVEEILKKYEDKGQNVVVYENILQSFVLQHKRIRTIRKQ